MANDSYSKLVSKLSKGEYQSTLELIGNDPDGFTDYFYDLVAKEIPEFNEIFKNTDLRLQKLELIKGFLQMFSLFEKEKELEGFLYDLGTRHVCYGVNESYYGPIKKVLILSMIYIHGDSWSNELEDSWNMFFEFMTESMLVGAKNLEVA